MSGTYPFVVKYQLRGQAHSVVVESLSEVLTADQARDHVEALHTSEHTSDITDISVERSAGQGPSEPGRQQAS